MKTVRANESRSGKESTEQSVMAVNIRIAIVAVVFIAVTAFLWLLMGQLLPAAVTSVAFDVPLAFAWLCLQKKSLKTVLIILLLSAVGFGTVSLVPVSLDWSVCLHAPFVGLFFGVITVA